MSIGYGALSTADVIYFIKRSVDKVTSVVDNAPYPVDLATVYVNSYPMLWTMHNFLVAKPLNASWWWNTSKTSSNCRRGSVSLSLNMDSSFQQCKRVSPYDAHNQDHKIPMSLTKSKPARLSWTLPVTSKLCHPVRASGSAIPPFWASLFRHWNNQWALGLLEFRL